MSQITNLIATRIFLAQPPGGGGGGGGVDTSGFVDFVSGDIVQAVMVTIAVAFMAFALVGRNKDIMNRLGGVVVGLAFLGVAVAGSWGAISADVASWFTGTGG